MREGIPIPRSVARRLRQAVLAGVFLGACHLPAWAQSRGNLKPLTDFPKRPQQNEWYFNQVQHKVWFYHNDAWQPFPCDDCRLVSLCNDHAIVKDGFHYMLGTQSGRVVVANAPTIRCMDAFIVVGSKNRIEYLLDEDSDTVSALVDNCKISIDTLQGDRVYCFPRYHPGLERYNCAELRNWGMMDAQGNWRIEPMFDKPFTFIDGVADVVYMGQHRNIDEEGMFLEQELEVEELREE